VKGTESVIFEINIPNFASRHPKNAQKDCSVGEIKLALSRLILTYTSGLNYEVNTKLLTYDELNSTHTVTEPCPPNRTHTTS
jgi:hypothetical protein